MKVVTLKRERFVIFFICCFMLIAVTRFTGDFEEIDSRIKSESIALRDIPDPSQHSSALSFLITTISLSKSDRRKEQDELFRPCITSSEIPEAIIEVRKSKTSLDDVHGEIFKDFHQKAKEATTLANRTLPRILRKRRSTKTTTTTIDQTISEMNLATDVDDYRHLPGGHWIPTSCQPLWRVAIVLGFRDRFHHLPIFLRHIVPLLKRQKLEFSIFISEQRNDLLFNKAMLMNIGFVEALNFSYYDCVVFHDIDHLAINIKNYYGCEGMPKHFESGEPRWNWGLLYDELFGGAVGMTTTQFLDINGLPNQYWGWGREDDDIYQRLLANGFKRSRPMGEIGYFDTLDHVSSPINSDMFCLITFCRERMTSDGISNLAYDTPTIELHPLYTNISVNIQRLPWNPKWRQCEYITTIFIRLIVMASILLIAVALRMLVWGVRSLKKPK